MRAAILLQALWLSADAYYNVGGETSIDGVGQRDAADTLRLGAGMGVRIWAGVDVILNYERVVAKPAGQPDAQTIRMTVQTVLVSAALMTRRGVGETNVFPNCLITYSNANLLKLFGGDRRPCRCSHSIPPLGGATRWHRQVFLTSSSLKH